MPFLANLIIQSVKSIVKPIVVSLISLVMMIMMMMSMRSMDGHVRGPGPSAPQTGHVLCEIVISTFFVGTGPVSSTEGNLAAVAIAIAIMPVMLLLLLMLMLLLLLLLLMVLMIMMRRMGVVVGIVMIVLGHVQAATVNTVVRVWRGTCY